MGLHALPSLASASLAFRKGLLLAALENSYSWITNRETRYCSHVVCHCSPDVSTGLSMSLVQYMPDHMQVAICACQQ